MTQQNKIRVLIVEDHALVRAGLKGMLADSEVQIVAEVTTVQAAMKRALEPNVDVVLMDLRLPDGDGLHALGRIKLDKPDLPILILSTYENPTYIARAVAMGANGYLLKGCTRDELLRAADRGRGRKHLDPRRTASRGRRWPRRAWRPTSRSP